MAHSPIRKTRQRWAPGRGGSIEHKFHIKGGPGPQHTGVAALRRWPGGSRHAPYWPITGWCFRYIIRNIHSRAPHGSGRGRPPSYSLQFILIHTPKDFSQLTSWNKRTVFLLRWSIKDRLGWANRAAPRRTRAVDSRQLPVPNTEGLSRPNKPATTYTTTRRLFYVTNMSDPPPRSSSSTLTDHVVKSIHAYFMIHVTVLTCQNAPKGFMVTNDSFSWPNFGQSQSDCTFLWRC